MAEFAHDEDWPASRRELAEALDEVLEDLRLEWQVTDDEGESMVLWKVGEVLGRIRDKLVGEVQR